MLDEPTNDLDVDTLRCLEDAVQLFAGTVLVISHDRWFLDRLCTHIMAFEGDSKVVWFEGSYSEYAEDLKKRMGGKDPSRIKYRKMALAWVQQTHRSVMYTHPISVGSLIQSSQRYRSEQPITTITLFRKLICFMLGCVMLTVLLCFWTFWLKTSPGAPLTSDAGHRMTKQLCQETKLDAWCLARWAMFIRGSADENPSFIRYTESVQILEVMVYIVLVEKLKRIKKTVCVSAIVTVRET